MHNDEHNMPLREARQMNKKLITSGPHHVKDPAMLGTHRHTLLDS
jgi:hypothetical protein